MWDTVGIAPFDREVYRALLRDPKAGTAAWAAVVNGSPARVRRSLDRLVAAGLIERLAHGILPVDPRIGVQALIRERRTELDLLARTVDELAVDFHQGQLHAQPLKLIEVVEGGQAILGRVSELLTSAEHEAVGLDGPPYLSTSTAATQTEARLLARGVGFRSLYAASSLGFPERLAHIQELADLGEEARVLPAVPLKLLIVDGRTALVPLTGGETGTGFHAIVIQRSALTDALVALFEVLWNQAAPLRIPVEDVPGPDGLTATDHTLIQLLGAGLKDEAIARRLDISERTLRRRIGQLLDRLGATGRFQAGAQAIRRGWLP